MRLETFAKNILKRREVNYLAARILCGNFVDVCPEINCLLANNTPNPALRILLQLLQILNYLVQRRGKGDDLDYQIRLNDFSAITQKAAQSKYATQQYLAQHPFAKKFLHSNHYFHLRSGLSEVLAVTTDNDFFQALQLYRLYLKFRKLRATTRAEQEIAHKLCDAYAGMVVETPLRDTKHMAPNVCANCCFFANSQSSSSSPEASPKEIELRSVV